MGTFFVTGSPKLMGFRSEKRDIEAGFRVPDDTEEVAPFTGVFSVDETCLTEGVGEGHGDREVMGMFAAVNLGVVCSKIFERT